MTTDDGQSDNSKERPRLLLHACCGPCALGIIEMFKRDYRVECFFYNPNVHPEAEYGLRLDEARHVARISGVLLSDDEYQKEEWFKLTRGLENEPEGGRRCVVCFRMRLSRTAERAKQRGMDLFATTLTVSPHKDADLVNETGLSVSRSIGIPFLAGDWKKKDGFKRSVELSREHGLFRQNYCGCKYSTMGKPESAD